MSLLTVVDDDAIANVSPAVSAVPDGRFHLYGMRAPELVALFAEHGVVCTEAEARRILGRLLSEGHDSLEGMKRPVSKGVRAGLERLTRRTPLVIAEVVRDDVDGFEKFLLRLDDGALVEAVKIPLEKPGHFTVCVSSQVGCAMGCVFCATGRLGLRRQLQRFEIVGQVFAVRASLRPGERLTGVVFMGQGEPLHNYDEVIGAASVLSDPCGGRIDARNISISTVGLVPQMHRYAVEGHKFRLVVSLHSTVAQRRKALLPIARQWSIDEVAGAIRALHQASGDRVTVAFCLMAGVNTGIDEVQSLQALLGDVPLRINLIDVNDSRSIEDGGFRPPSALELRGLLDALQALKQPVVRRYSGGKNTEAACGMLASRHLADEAARAGLVTDAVG
jgi:23S rRNA (adenine2503-C2)-methyltransferase